MQFCGSTEVCVLQYFFFLDFLSSYVTMETGEFEMGIIAVIANVWVFIGGGLKKIDPIGSQGIALLAVVALLEGVCLSFFLMPWDPDAEL